MVTVRYWLYDNNYGILLTNFIFINFRFSESLEKCFFDALMSLTDDADVTEVHFWLHIRL